MMALLVLGPILEQFVTIRKLIDIFLTAIILTMLYTITSKKRVFYFGWSLAIIMLLSLWLKFFISYDVFAPVSMMAGVLFTVLVTSQTVQFIIRSKTVTREVVYWFIFYWHNCGPWYTRFWIGSTRPRLICQGVKVISCYSSIRVL
ncbi:MAG: hypothetical protein OET21_09150 [Desulfobacterales bacterium]|nr:hypothetical protein [Desulfobacterales bacterium]